MKKSFLILLVMFLLLAFFLTTFTGQATNSMIRLKVLGQTEFYSGGPASLRIITMNEHTMKPVSSVYVSIKLISGDHKHRLFSGLTDDTGSIEASFTIPENIEGNSKLQIIASSGAGRKELSVDVNIKKAYQLLLTTDKPLYQPSQTINLRLLALSRANMLPVKSLPVTFEIQDAKGNKVFKGTSKLSDFGVASAKFTLADEVNMGDYHIKAFVEKDTIEKNVTVKRYVLPKFNNTISTDKEYYQPGQTVKGSVEARYFFGKPIKGGEVKLTFSTFDVAVTKLGEITGKTDENGLYSFEYKLPDYFTGLPLDQGKGYLDMEVSVIDGAKHQEIKTKTLPIVKFPIQVTLVPERAQLMSDVDNIVYILASYPDGSPAKSSLEIKLNGKTEKIKTDDMGFAEISVKPDKKMSSLSYEIHCSDNKGNEATVNGNLTASCEGDAILLRTDKALYRVGESIKLDVFSSRPEGTAYLDIIRDGQTILTKSLTINNGKGNLEWNFTPDCAGSLTLHVYRITPRGQIIRDSRKIVLTPGNDLKIDVSMDKKSYLPGEESKIIFRVINKEGKPVISVIGVDIVDESLFALAERKPGFEKLYFLLESELLEPKYEIHGIDLSGIVSKFDEGKNIEDGQKLSQMIMKKAPQNEPFSLNKDSYVEELKTLYNNFNTVYNVIYSFYYAKGHYPSGMAELLKDKYINKESSLDPWGNSINIIKKDNNYFELISLGPDGKKGTEDDISYNNIYQLLEGSVPFNDPFWAMAGGFAVDEEAGLLRANADAAVVPMPSSASATEANKVSQQEQGQAPARVREYFPETLYTNPEVITDNKGMATVNVTMADSITTWRLTSFASSLKGEMGNSQSGITVFQDFFVDIDLPVFLTQGDEISIPVAVYNYLPGKQKVELEIVKDKWFKLMDEPVKKIDLAKDQVSVVYFRIKAIDVGLKPVTIYARGSEMSDAIKRTIQVEPNGKMFLATESDRLNGSLSKKITIPGDAIEGADKLILTIYPGLFSQIVEGLDSILRMPSGCFEQTSSTTYPNVLVLDYLKKSNKITPEIEMKAETYINNGYQRLLTFEVSGGGFSWFGDAPANKLLTAFGLMEFKDMSKVHNIDPALITRTQQWLASKQNADGSWSPDESYLHAESWSRLQNSNLLVTAYITWALLDTEYENKSVLDKAVLYIKEHYTQAKDPYMLAVMANALAEYNPADPVLGKVVEALMLLKKEDKESIYWESALESVTFSTGISSTIESTAMITYALLKADIYPDVVNKCITFLIKNKDGYGTWHSTQPTILTLRTLLLAAEKSQENVAASGSILINGKKFKEFNINSENFDVYQQFDLSSSAVEGQNQVEIKFEGKGNCLYQIVTKYYLPWNLVKEDEIVSPLSIDISYDRTKISQNDLVTCKAKVTNKSDGDLKMTVLDLGIPPGFSVETDKLEQLVKDKVIQKYSLTGRQIIIYINEISAKKSLEVTYQLRAKYPLKVQSPRSQVYEYYNPEHITKTRPVEMIVD